MCGEERRASCFCVTSQENVSSGVPWVWRQDSFWFFLSFSKKYWATVFSFLIWPAFWEWRQRGKIEPNKWQWLQVLSLNHFPAVLESDPVYPSWKWGTPFSLQSQYVSVEPIQLGCTFLMFCTSSSWPVRTTGLLVTISLTSDGWSPPATGAPCWVPSPPHAGPALWAGTVDDALGSCLLFCSVRWLGQNPSWPASWTRDIAVCTWKALFHSVSSSTGEQFQWLTLHSLSTLWLVFFLVCFLWWSLFPGLYHPKQ